jgi:hypothetical protein
MILNLWSVSSLNNSEDDKKEFFKKCYHEGDENVDYFNSLMTKLMNTKYRH